MLKAHIDVTDLVFTPCFLDGKLKIGRSVISAYDHACCETLFIQATDRWFYVVREQLDSSPDTLTQFLHNPDEYRSLYQENVRWPLDYVLIEVVHNGQNARLRVRAGSLGMAPLYFSVSQGKLTLSWDFADLAAIGSHAIDFEIAAHFLALHTFYTSRQVCTGISMLTERSSLYVDGSDVRFIYPSAAPEAVPMPLRAEVDALAVFETLLNSALSARKGAVDTLALELSGGMDSTAVAVAAVTRWGAPIVSKGIILSGKCRESQIQRRQIVAEQLGLSDEQIEMTDFMPTLNLNPLCRNLEHPFAELYLDAFQALWASVSASGRGILLTGIGGDELFPRFDIDPGMKCPRAGDRLHVINTLAESLLTKRALHASRAALLCDAPRGVIPETSLLANVCRSPYMLRNGLWPVNPLCDPNLVAYCHRLPVEYRLKRELVRRYLRTKLKSDLFPINYEKETFESVLPEVIAQHSDRIGCQLRECALADLGLVKLDAVKALLDKVARTRNTAATAPVAFFLFLERFVRQIG